MKINELLEAQERAAPKTDLRVGDHVTADTSKEQYPGGHKSRSGKVTRVGQTGVHIQPDDGGEREYHPYKIVKKSQDVAEDATAGATSSASIATVSAPQLSPGAARGKKSYTGTPGHSGTKAPPQPKPKAQKPTDNALNMKGTSIFGHPLNR
jgi:hypothetical protein